MHYVSAVTLMSESGLTFQICRASEDSEALRQDRNTIVNGLVEFNKKASLVHDPIWVFMRDRKNRVVGGVLAYTLKDWLHIEILWVEESFRNKGNGTRLLRMAENEAVKRGCRHVDLDTMSWQARPFYEKLDYTVFATLDNYPEGHRRHFMKKDLR